MYEMEDPVNRTSIFSEYVVLQTEKEEQIAEMGSRYEFKIPLINLTRHDQIIIKFKVPQRFHELNQINSESQE